MKIRAFTVSALMATGAVLMTIPEYSGAQAYTVTLNGRTAGSLNGGLNDIGLHSGDIGRVLDPTIFSLAPGQYGGKNLTESLAAKAIVTVVDLTENVLSLKFDVHNQSNPSKSGYKAAILGLWFGVSPDATGASTPGGTIFDSVRVDPEGNAPGGFKNIDICIYAANNCEGGNVNKGLQAGEYDSFSINILGNFGVYDSNGNYTHSEVTISDFGIKYQTDDGSYELAGVPEPLTILGSGTALSFGVLMQRRASRKKRLKAAEQVVS